MYIKHNLRLLNSLFTVLYKVLKNYSNYYIELYVGSYAKVHKYIDHFKRFVTIN